MTEHNGWTEWSRHVLKELERLNTCYESLSTKMGIMQTEIATLKERSSVWGGIAGTIAGIVVGIIATLLNG